MSKEGVLSVARSPLFAAHAPDADGDDLCDGGELLHARHDGGVAPRIALVVRGEVCMSVELQNSERAEAFCVGADGSEGNGVLPPEDAHKFSLFEKVYGLFIGCLKHLF